MIKVITYGTFDLLHYGHISLLERAKALGDYLIVGVTSDDYDKSRGKINNHQTLSERIMAIRALGIADEVIVEEYEGQKIDDVRKYDVDVFTVGTDWKGKFDYLSDYCKVVYLDRTEGISSTEVRAARNRVKIGLIGESNSDLTSLDKFFREIQYVNGAIAHCANTDVGDLRVIEDYDELLNEVDAVYITSHPSKHYDQVRKALLRNKHVLCESPVTLNSLETKELFELAEKNHCILMEGLKTAYVTAYERLILLAKTGKIGKVLSVDATCTSMKQLASYRKEELAKNWNTITEWGPPVMLPVFQILGTNYEEKRIFTRYLSKEVLYDDFTKIDFVYKDAVACVKCAKGAKSEGELVITGTEGYIYVPAPWWKTDYFEIRYENQSDNRRYFYQLDGEGIRYEIVAFTRMIESGKNLPGINRETSIAISKIMEAYYNGDVIELK